MKKDSKNNRFSRLLSIVIFLISLSFSTYSSTINAAAQAQEIWYELTQAAEKLLEYTTENSNVIPSQFLIINPYTIAIGTVILFGSTAYAVYQWAKSNPSVSDQTFFEQKILEEYGASCDDKDYSCMEAKLNKLISRLNEHLDAQNKKSNDHLITNHQEKTDQISEENSSFGNEQFLPIATDPYLDATKKYGKPFKYNGYFEDNDPTKKKDSLSKMVEEVEKVMWGSIIDEEKLKKICKAFADVLTGANSGNYQNKNSLNDVEGFNDRGIQMVENMNFILEADGEDFLDNWQSQNRVDLPFGIVQTTKGTQSTNEPNSSGDDKNKQSSESSGNNGEDSEENNPDETNLSEIKTSLNEIEKELLDVVLNNNALEDDLSQKLKLKLKQIKESIDEKYKKLDIKEKDSQKIEVIVVKNLCDFENQYLDIVEKSQVAKIYLTIDYCPTCLECKEYASKLTDLLQAGAVSTLKIPTAGCLKIFGDEGSSVGHISLDELIFFSIEDAKFTASEAKELLKGLVKIAVPPRMISFVGENYAKNTRLLIDKYLPLIDLKNECVLLRHELNIKEQKRRQLDAAEDIKKWRQEKEQQYSNNQDSSRSSLCNIL